MITVYGIPNCNKIRNTLGLLDRSGISYEFVNVRKTPLSAGKLKEITDRLGIDTLFNTKGTTYRRLNLDYRNMDKDEKFSVLLSEQAMIKRPLIENAGRYHAGFDEQAIMRFVGR